MATGNGYRSLSIVHKTLLIGQVICAAACFYIIYSGSAEPPSPESNRMLQVISIVLGAGGFFGGAALFKKKLAEINSGGMTDREKFAAYRSACIVQWALIEAPCIFCSVSYFITGNYAFLMLAGALILVFMLAGPAKVKVAYHLGISPEQVDQL